MGMNFDDAICVDIYTLLSHDGRGQVFGGLSEKSSLVEPGDGICGIEDLICQLTDMFWDNHAFR
jgi:hypothetical protein